MDCKAKLCKDAQKCLLSLLSAKPILQRQHSYLAFRYQKSYNPIRESIPAHLSLAVSKLNIWMCVIRRRRV